MRLGEIKKIIEKTLDGDGKVAIKHESLYEGNAHLVSNFAEVVSVIDLLHGQNWNELDYTQIKEIRDKYGDVEKARIETDEFNQLNSYIDSLNAKIPLYYSILETMVAEQDAQVINVKIPKESIKTLESLAELNKSLSVTFKKFQIDGDFEFRGFDIGTSWYELYVVGFLTFNFFIGCLKIAQEFFKAKKEYYSSEEAKAFYQASLDAKKQFSDTGLKKFIVKKLDIEVEQKIVSIMGKIKGRNGHKEKELLSKLVTATKGLVKEFDEGVEFHLSLNPPSYAKETAEGLSIDYKNIKRLETKDSKPKQLKKQAREQDTNQDESAENV